MNKPKVNGKYCEETMEPYMISMTKSQCDEEKDNADEEDFGLKFKLTTFPANHFGPNFDEDVLLSKEDFPSLSQGDVLEIFQPDSEHADVKPRLLVMIGPNSLNFDNQLSKPLNRETLYIEKSIADSFSLQNFKDVFVRQIDPSQIVLDTVELTFRDQYMGRSEMWRIKKKLIGTCVFLNKKVDICQGTVRCQIFEMWGQGERVACGIVTSVTKIVFRSTSAMIYLFIQMSSEMWDFDNFGNLYFENAVEGFLAEMFEKWKVHGSSHEVTIVLFSRSFYVAKSKNDFPEKMRECLQLGFDGNFFEDFYSVVVQNERFNDWSPVVLQLRKIFTDYKNSILNYHKSGFDDDDNDINIPHAYISTAAQGNFLEVLNMSLNTFENHYLNRNLDRTGQQCLVITPGVGLFEVDRELMLVTKQRILDSGVGSDLICVGEQPLHAVPLFKLYNNGMSESQGGDDIYCMPHWINLSFYNKPRRVFGRNSTFVPRIRLPTQVEAQIPIDVDTLTNEYYPKADDFISPEMDITKDPTKPYEDYDSSVFDLPKSKKRCHTILRTTSKPDEQSLIINSATNVTSKRKLSVPEVRIAEEGFSTTPNTEPNFGIRKHLNRENESCSISQENLSMIQENDEKCGIVESSLMDSIDRSFDHQAIKKFLLRPGRVLINPFDTSLTEIRMTSNRRRWTHIFPKSSNKMHYFNFELTSTQDDAEVVNEGPSNSGVDWKSLTIPASLPLTTDYFPSLMSLVNEYLVNEYDLTPEEIWNDCQHSPLEKNPLTNEEVYVELVSQRLAQGFQLIIFPDEKLSSKTASHNGKSSHRYSESQNSVWLSIGRIYHRLTLSADKKQIKVTCYRPRHPYPKIAFHYRYRFEAPDSTDYEVSWVEFKTEQHENFNWNRMDFYVCTRGDKEFILTESLKYWRFRLYVLPVNQFQPYTKKILDGDSAHGNIYSVRLNDDHSELTEGFLRFVEICMNRLKRGTNQSSSSTSAMERSRANTSNIRGRIPTNSRLKKLKSSLGMASTSLDRMGNSSPTTLKLSPDCSNSYESSFSPPKNGCEESNGRHQIKLRLNSTLSEIFDAMKSPHFGGLTFFNKVQGLPSLTFIAHQAVTWILKHLVDVSDVEMALKILQNMINKKLICHASGNQDFPFQNGHHLYFVIQNGPNSEWPVYDGDLESFQNDWVEIGIENMKPLKHTKQQQQKQQQDQQQQGHQRRREVPEFLQNSLERFREREQLHHSQSGRFYKFVTFDTDNNSKSERKEWGHLKYQRRYEPRSTFELTLQWCVATGSIISDLIHGWARKSGQCGFSLIPIPHDPFALPITKNSDPVRGPIFVPLDTDCLMENRSFLFEDFPEASWEQRLLLFREEIALSFGFINCLTDRAKSRSTQFTTDHQFIHCTGNMFLLIPTYLQQQTGIQGLRRKSSVARHHLSASLEEKTFELKASPIDESLPSKVNRHLTESKPAYEHSETGFIWSWNFMISKRWKQISNAGATGDIPFMDMMLADFRAFCANEDNRLKTFWDECWNKKKENEK